MYSYKVAADGSLATQAGAYEVPKKTQGLLVTASRFIYSTSYGNDNRSNIYVVDGGARTISPSTAKCFRAPSMTEGITEYGGKAVPRLRVRRGAVRGEEPAQRHPGDARRADRQADLLQVTSTVGRNGGCVSRRTAAGRPCR